jgi:hypothetical protein
VFHPRHIHRSAIACGIVLTLAVPGTALAQQDLRSPDARDAAVTHKQAAPAQDLRNPDTRDPAQLDMRASVATALAQERSDAALAQERSYSSYGKPEPVAAAHAPAAPDDSHWLTIALSIAAVLAVVALSVMTLRRLRLRRRRAVTAS